MFDWKKLFKQVGITLLLCVPLSIIFKKHFLFVFVLVEAVILTQMWFLKSKKKYESEIKDVNRPDYIDVSDK